MSKEGEDDYEEQNEVSQATRYLLRVKELESSRNLVHVQPIH